MDMKKLLQIVDQSTKKSVVDSTDMKKFISIISENTKSKEQGVAENFADSNSNDLFLNNLYKMLKQKYPKAEFNLKSDSIESTDGQLTVIAGVEEDDDDYVGCFMWDVQTGPYKGVLQPAIKQTTEQLLQSNPGKEPALFIGGDNENPQAWKRIARNLGYEYISDDELDENFADGKYDAKIKDLEKIIADLKSKQGVAEEGYGNHPSQRVDPRTGKKYVPPKSPLKQGDVKHKQKQFEQGVAEGLSFKDYVNLAEAKKKITAKEDPCWKGYKMVGTKKKGGREVPNCVPGKKGD